MISAHKHISNRITGARVKDSEVWEITAGNDYKKVVHKNEWDIEELARFAEDVNFLPKALSVEVSETGRKMLLASMQWNDCMPTTKRQCMRRN